MVWNQLVPQRRPRMIVQVANENAVIEAVRFARANGMKVAIRGGGHSWIGLSLRDDSLLIDLGRLKNLAVDRADQIAVIQPAVTSSDFSRRLTSEGLAFPVGHCPTVPMSGFLLNGGIGWNFNAWGPSCSRIEGARIVTADGNLAITNEKENTDLLWAVRGAGPGFFGIVTEYTVRVFSAPGDIITSTYHYPLDVICELGEWAAGFSSELARQVEMTLFVSAAPPQIADRCKASNGFACGIIATAFADSASTAESMLEILDKRPFATNCLSKSRNVPTPIKTLHDMNSLSTPPDHRYLTETFWTNSPPAEVLAASREHFMEAPSSKSIRLFSFFTGGESWLPRDCAYSMSGGALLICSTAWERAEDDSANTAWHRATIAALDQYAIGHYIGESDIITDPRRAERSYSSASWQRLQMLRQRYDPGGLFHGLLNLP